MGVAQTLSLISSLGGAAKSVAPAVTSATSSVSSAWNGLSTAGKWTAGGTALTGVLGLAGNFMSAGNTDAESLAMQQEGDLALHESIIEAAQIEEQGIQFKADQKAKFIMSGVSLAGSPLIVLNDTSRKVQEEIDAVKIRGEAQRTLAYTRAAITKSEGWASLLSGIVKTGGSVLNLYGAAKGAGLFDKAPAKGAT